MPRTSRVKGSRFERDISRILSEFIGIEVRRTPASGGFDRIRFPGDLYCSDLGFRLRHVWECKKREGWRLEALFAKKSNCHPIYVWWNSVRAEALRAKKAPILCFSKNLCPVWVMIGDENMLHKVPKIYLPTGQVILRFEDFLKGVTKEYLMERNEPHAINRTATRSEKLAK